MRDTRHTGYPVAFTQAPPIGTQVTYWGGHAITLIEVRPYMRKDGRESNLLVWETSEGRKGTTGLRSKSLTWERGK